MYWSLKRVINKLRKEFSQPVHEKADGRPAALNSSCSFLSQHFLLDCPNWCARATASFSSIGMSFEHSLSQYLNIPYEMDRKLAKFSSYSDIACCEWNVQDMLQIM